MHSLQPFLPLLCLLLLAAVIVQFFLIAGLNGRVARQTQSLRAFFTSANGEDIETLLHNTLEKSHEAVLNSQDSFARLDAIEQRLATCLQHVGLVRYDAFGDVTGKQSFSLALLNGDNTGAIITALFGRSNCLCYGKMIQEGAPQQLLTDEEQAALIQALDQKLNGNR